MTAGINQLTVIEHERLSGLLNQEFLNLIASKGSVFHYKRSNCRLDMLLALLIREVKANVLNYGFVDEKGNKIKKIFAAPYQYKNQHYIAVGWSGKPSENIQHTINVIMSSFSPTNKETGGQFNNGFGYTRFNLSTYGNRYPHTILGHCNRGDSLEYDKYKQIIIEKVDPLNPLNRLSYDIDSGSEELANFIENIQKTSKIGYKLSSKGLNIMKDLTFIILIKVIDSSFLNDNMIEVIQNVIRLEKDMEILIGKQLLSDTNLIKTEHAFERIMDKNEWMVKFYQTYDDKFIEKFKNKKTGIKKDEIEDPEFKNFNIPKLFKPKPLTLNFNFQITPKKDEIIEFKIKLTIQMLIKKYFARANPSYTGGGYITSKYLSQFYNNAKERFENEPLFLLNYENTTKAIINLINSRLDLDDLHHISFNQIFVVPRERTISTLSFGRKTNFSPSLFIDLEVIEERHNGILTQQTDLISTESDFYLKHHLLNNMNVMLEAMYNQLQSEDLTEWTTLISDNFIKKLEKTNYFQFKNKAENNIADCEFTVFYDEYYEDGTTCYKHQILEDRDATHLAHYKYINGQKVALNPDEISTENLVYEVAIKDLTTNTYKKFISQQTIDIIKNTEQFKKHIHQIEIIRSPNEHKIWLQCPQFKNVPIYLITYKAISKIINYTDLEKILKMNKYIYPKDIKYEKCSANEWKKIWQYRTPINLKDRLIDEDGKIINLPLIYLRDDKKEGPIVPPSGGKKAFNKNFSWGIADSGCLANAPICEIRNNIPIWNKNSQLNKKLMIEEQIEILEKNKEINALHNNLTILATCLYKESDAFFENNEFRKTLNLEDKKNGNPISNYKTYRVIQLNKLLVGELMQINKKEGNFKKGIIASIEGKNKKLYSFLKEEIENLWEDFSTKDEMKD